MSRDDAISLIRFAHPFPSVLVAVVTVALIPIADPDAPTSMYVVLGLGMLLYQFSIGFTNDVADRDDDAVNKPWKAIPRGLVSPRTGAIVAAGCALAGMAVTFGLDTGAWLVGVAALSCGLVYDLGMKRTPLSWLPLAIALPMIPAWVWIANDAWDPILWWAFPLGAILGLAIHLANQQPDVEQERGRVRGAAHLMGVRRARLISLSLFGLAASIAVVILLFEAPDRALYAAIVAFTVWLLAGRSVRLFGRDGLFGLMAAGSAVLAGLFLSVA